MGHLLFYPSIDMERKNYDLTSIYCYLMLLCCCSFYESSLFKHDFWKGKGGVGTISSAFQSSMRWRHRVSVGSLAGHIGEAMGGPPICMLCFGIPAILFYRANTQKQKGKNKLPGGRGDKSEDTISLLVRPQGHSSDLTDPYLRARKKVPKATR